MLKLFEMIPEGEQPTEESFAASLALAWSVPSLRRTFETETGRGPLLQSAVALDDAAASGSAGVRNYVCGFAFWYAMRTNTSLLFADAWLVRKYEKHQAEIAEGLHRALDDESKRAEAVRAVWGDMAHRGYLRAVQADEGSGLRHLADAIADLALAHAAFVALDDREMVDVVSGRGAFFAGILAGITSKGRQP